MSTLFDRLCDLAAQEHLTVILAADTRRSSGVADRIDLAEVLARAADVERLDLWIVSLPTTRSGADTAMPEVRLTELDDETRLRAAAAAIDAIETGGPSTLHLVNGTMSVTGASPMDARSSAGRAHGRGLMVATDRPGWSEQLADARERGVAVSIGGFDASAAFTVEDISGVVSMLDALVVLRSAASDG